MYNQEQQNRIKESRRRFIETGEGDPDIRPWVRASWERCARYGNHETYSLDIRSGSELNQLLESNKDLLDAAHPIMMKLVDMVEGTQYAVTLHDRDGWIIDHLFAGDHPIFSIKGFNLGVRWAEDTIGTCSSHLAVIEDREIQLTGYEHFNERLTCLVGTAAPIHNGEGEIIGCLNMCGYYASGTSHTLGLIQATAGLIEKSLELRRVGQLLKDSFDMMSDGIIILDNRFRVIQVSFQAAAILKIPQKAVYSVDFAKLFPKEDFEQRLWRSNAPFSYAEYEFALDGKTTACNVQVAPLVSGGIRNGVMIILRESKEIRRLANKMTGNRASYSFGDIITQDREMLAQIDIMKDIASTDCCVLIEGESGCGKELFAHSLHNASARRNGPFIAVNCASLPRNLVESELFGYEKGAFTGARSDGSPGKFELAEGGTIFLDEIGELPLEIQATLLRVLDNHKVVRIGGKQEKSLDVRVIAATNRNLYHEVQCGNFRSDLFYRINVLRFGIPPLCRRKGDVPLLARTFLDRMNETQTGRPKTFQPEFLQALCSYPWPGNVRELQNVIVRAYYASKGDVITEAALPYDFWADSNPVQAGDRRQPSAGPGKATAGRPAAGRPRESEDEARRQRLIEALGEAEGDPELAGRILGISRATVYRRIKKYGIVLK